MTPGPVPLPPCVQEAFCLQCHHSCEEFSSIFKKALQGLGEVFQTQQPCFLLNSTGTGAMEATYVNTLSPKDSVLVVNSGKFGNRWAEMGRALGLEIEELVFGWGQRIDLDQVDKELRKKNYKALAVQACETSSGSLLPIKHLAQMVKHTETLFIVDAISALGALSLPMDDWGIDALIGGSQKALMLPTGMAFISLSPKAWEQKNLLPKYYWDLRKEKQANAKGRTRFSTPTHFVLALDQALDQILHQVGLQQTFLNIQKKAEFFRSQVQLPLFPQEPSPSLSCLLVEAPQCAIKIQKNLLKKGISVAVGQGEWKNRLLRVGHMGDMTLKQLEKTALEINQCLN